MGRAAKNSEAIHSPSRKSLGRRSASLKTEKAVVDTRPGAKARAARKAAGVARRAAKEADLVRRAKTEPLPDIRKQVGPPSKIPSHRRPYVLTKNYRLCTIAHLYLTGVGKTQDQIRDILEADYGIKQSRVQVTRDIAELEEGWRRTTELKMDEAVKLEQQKLDMLEQAADELRDRGSIRDYDSIMLKIAKRRSSLMGYDKAQKFQIDNPNALANMSDSELEKVLSEEVQRREREQGSGESERER